MSVKNKLSTALLTDMGRVRKNNEDAVGEDLEVPCGMPFPKQMQLKKGESVVFAYIVYKSRKDRDRINKKVMADPRLSAMGDPNKMPFDGKRMMWGGFKGIVEY